MTEKTPLRWFVGFDSRNYGQTLAYEVCKKSLEKHCSDKYEIQVEPLVLKELEEKKLFWRDFDKLASTEFTYTRFLVPYLTGYKGLAVFCDSDFLWVEDPSKVLDYLQEGQAVSCVQHDYTPHATFKMDGRAQTVYPRKNWSSLLVFNCDHPSTQQLTLENVNTQSPAWLHRLQWAKDEEIGEIPYQYNYLVGYYNTKDPVAIHYTDGGPWHPGYEDCEFGDLWTEYLNDEEKAKLQAEIDEYYQEHPEVKKSEK